MLWTKKKKKILIACKIYQHSHVFHVASRQKVDIDDTISEKNRRIRDFVDCYTEDAHAAEVRANSGLFGI